MSLDFLKHTREFQNLVATLEEGRKGVRISGLVPAAKPYFLSLLRQVIRKPIVLIRPAEADLSGFAQECRTHFSLLGSDEEPGVLPPLSESLDPEIPPSLEAVSSRMFFLRRLLKEMPSVCVTNLLGISRALPHPRFLPELFLEFESGESLGRDRLIRRLSAFGYTRQDLVNSPGEFAARGGIVDVFSPWETHPSRVEFSADRVASVREFHPSTQRSFRKILRLTIPSLREHPFEDEPPGNDAGEECVPFDTLCGEALLVAEEFEELEKESEEIRRAAKSFPLQEKLFLLRAWDMIRRNAVRLNGVLSEEKNAFRFRSQSLPQFDNRIPFFLDYLRKMLEERERCYLFFSNPGVRQKMSVLLRQHRIPHTLAETPCVMPPDGAAVLLQGNLIRGFRFPQERITFFSEREVLTEERVLVSRRHVRPFVSDFRDLKVNDYVVHSDFGVGVFKGLVKMAVDEEDREFIEIHYQDEDKLFVPTENLNLVQKYTSFGAAVPQVHKLGSPSWARAKARAKKAIERMARDLLHLYAQRKAAQGHRFSPGGTWQQEFEQMFEFEETEDQLQAIKDIYGDMESPSPMDRLLCGDVGYGKTEVAVRAAFKAVMDGKQVAVLCPTTVLASQHLETFRKRMMLFPVRVESLSRLQSRACQKKILQDLQKGLVDIVIGTHRLLSKDVEFRDLGLLIVDEEQRFGVAHKEKIKHLKAHIDVLTMTATPIPRTLNLSLSGLRDISLIETPPRDRLSVHTVVTTFQPKLIGSAIAKELAREGQVYFVHNRIEDIEEMAQAIQRWVPHARVAVIHGRMATRILEQRMIDFIQQKYDVLVSTSIIENGIDIPRVNTLIVDRAHTFGLAQLYQLRGRVGRSARQAFAYFLIPPFAELGRLSKERLKALQEFTELGSGFRLAAKDLEIRGAGNFLGAEQHGHMDALGFDYYMHLLNQTVREIKGEAAVEVKSEIQMRMDIRIPEEYLPQQSLRLQLYKRVSSIESLDELETIRKDIQDRFGPAPVSVEKLLGYGAIKFLAQRCGIRTVDRLGKRLIIQFFEHSGVDPGRIQAVFRRFHGSLTPQGVMRVVLSSEEETDLMVETISILKELSGI